MVGGMIYRCPAELATGWVTALKAAQFDVIDVRTGIESNGAASCSGTVRAGRAYLRIIVGPGGPGKFGPYEQDDCYLWLSYTKPLIFKKGNSSHALAVSVENALFSAGIRTFDETMRLGK
jgi:hypothetical protein